MSGSSLTTTLVSSSILFILPAAQRTSDGPTSRHNLQMSLMLWHSVWPCVKDGLGVIYTGEDSDLGEDIQVKAEWKCQTGRWNRGIVGSQTLDQSRVYIQLEWLKAFLA